MSDHSASTVSGPQAARAGRRVNARWAAALALAVVALAVVAPPALACSPIRSQEFHLQAAPTDERKPPPLKLLAVNFAPWISDDEGTCGGVGFLNIELPRSWNIERYGLLVRAKSGVNDPGLFPEYPLAAIRDYQGKITVAWPWTGIAADADGHVRWRLELVPVSRSGVQGEPVSICVASDDSCPELVGAAG
ncbi:hypothetical protein K4L06_04680 [Lysobacter sp. BMK333-48F3]|uniref:hypothetical protein n=1 Tax=Lysobacter sp. BMK333-48F3 TaxID=2867962 RepID=UPI001C8C6AB9|nr:hypothetical protein [Lysobacter sp. BMK333-48F3]MBX9400598.1 hypothetical protein [Lysobacter sp. BMK333-48F3]